MLEIIRSLEITRAGLEMNWSLEITRGGLDMSYYKDDLEAG